MASPPKTPKQPIWTELYAKVNKRGVCDDLVLLDTVSNESICELLETRLRRQDMYTSIGNGVAKHYFAQGSTHTAPHIFRIGADALRALAANRENQAIIVTGESGAGKTEAAKQLMQFVTVVGTTTDAQRERMETVKRQLLESNPVLEAFGNAQTIRNDNSSRFGKLMELQFSYKGAIQGGRVTSYLLEKSRVTAQSPGERNFHVFHYLVASSREEREEYGVLPAAQYQSLSCQERKVPGVNDATRFAELKRSMSAIGISADEQRQVFTLLSAVLALGNVYFKDKGDAVRAGIADAAVLNKAARLLQVPAEDLQTALTSATLHGGREGVPDAQKMRKNLTAPDSEKNRDTLAKELYRRVFDWLVGKVNIAIEAETGSGHGHGQQDLLTMGVLDVYGFEIFDTNGFEQLCINYANEKLQQFFISRVIKAEQDDYRAEGITWSDIVYFDNAGVLDMIEGKTGLLSLLDEQCAYRDSTSTDLVNRLNKACAERPYYISGRGLLYGDRSQSPPAPPSKAAGKDAEPGAASSTSTMANAHPLPPNGRRGSTPDRGSVRMGRNGIAATGDITKMFGIRHYAGDVAYTADDLFMDKNRDSMYQDLGDLIARSENPLAAGLFEGHSQQTLAQRAKRPVSISAQFKRQVGALHDTLAKCAPHYVRCIKPNDDKAPCAADTQRVSHQPSTVLALLEVTYLGLEENLRVRRQGFVHRISYADFARRYKAVSAITWPDAHYIDIWPDGTSVDPKHPEPPRTLIDAARAKAKAIGAATGGAENSAALTPGASPRTAPASAAASPAGGGRGAQEAAVTVEVVVAVVEAEAAEAAQVAVKIVPQQRRVFERCTLSDRDAVMALLSGGKPKRWDRGLTGGKPLVLPPLKVSLDSQEVVMGRTKVFIRHPDTLFALEEQWARTLAPVATLLQRCVRAYCRRRVYRKAVAAAPRAHALARGFLARQVYRRVRGGVIALQALAKGRRQRCEYAELRVRFKGTTPCAEAMKLQRAWRGHAARGRLPRALLSRTLPLGASLLAGLLRLRGAVRLQCAWRRLGPRRALIAARTAARAIQCLQRQRRASVVRAELTEAEFGATLELLHEGVVLVKHTIKKMVGTRRLVEATFTLSSDNTSLNWDTGSATSRGGKGVLLRDVTAITKSRAATEVLQMTGDVKKSDEGLCAGGLYFSLHTTEGKTLDLEAANYHTRDALVMTLDRLRQQQQQQQA
ncbi:P-loop containing nucleoside triphosphate hydrolase protein [Tribonema minus]|uniref:P-loop containing nucleoside triphosphate hydrolase protein n=1 Tax=Tribonema minus TaxID=303371 RepID=A0A835YR46_9STRA|nr:P-loop containing nucleoside triphosphate hydrolase protein [Tribonema minus]